MKFTSIIFASVAAAVSAGNIRGDVDVPQEGVSLYDHVADVRVGLKDTTPPLQPEYNPTRPPIKSDVNSLKDTTPTLQPEYNPTRHPIKIDVESLKDTTPPLQPEYNPTRPPLKSAGGDAYGVVGLADLVVELGKIKPGAQCLNTFRCKVNGGECMPRRACLGKGPGYTFKHRLCQRKPWFETLAMYKTLGPLAGKFQVPKIPKIDFFACGCCIPPEEPEPEPEECPWGCAPADYSTCACAPSSKAGCESHGDQTGDLVCAWNGASCVGCSAYDGDSAGCNAAANCEFKAHDSKCHAKGTTTSPATDYLGNTC